MPQELIVIFLLFFAVLAFAWFYWQRAKARDARAVTTEASEPTRAEMKTHTAPEASAPPDVAAPAESTDRPSSSPPS